MVRKSATASTVSPASGEADADHLEERVARALIVEAAGRLGRALPASGAPPPCRLRPPVPRRRRACRRWSTPGYPGPTRPRTRPASSSSARSDRVADRAVAASIRPRSRQSGEAMAPHHRDRLVGLAQADHGGRNAPDGEVARPACAMGELEREPGFRLRSRDVALRGEAPRQASPLLPLASRDRGSPAPPGRPPRSARPRRGRRRAACARRGCRPPGAAKPTEQGRPPSADPR